jgi:hypothetical protein
MVSRYASTLNVSPKSITVNRDDIKALCEIALKAFSESEPYSYRRFTIEGKKQTVSSQDISDLLKARWPSVIEDLSINVQSGERSIQIHLSRDGLTGYNKIVVSSLDVDWVSARVTELENFVSDHRNIHWIFHNWLSVVPQAILLWFLALSGLVRVNLSDDVVKALATPVAFGVMGLYFGLGKLYPFTSIDNGRATITKSLRKIISFLLVTIFVGLIGALISKWIQ